MDSRLFMEIGVNSDGELEVIDQTPYERWINDGDFDSEHNHVVLERIVKADGDDDPWTYCIQLLSDNLTPEQLRHSATYDLNGDGLYHYQKLIIPKYYEGIEETNNYLYYDSRVSKVVYIDQDSGIDEAWDVCNDYDDIYNTVVDEAIDNCFHFDEDLFSMYDLVKCYVYIERERIQNYIKNHCFEGCKQYSDLDDKAGILLAAVTVIKNLIDEEDYFEAQRILNGLNTCGGLCGQYLNKLKGCGCGRT